MTMVVIARKENEHYCDRTINNVVTNTNKQLPAAVVSTNPTLFEVDECEKIGDDKSDNDEDNDEDTLEVVQAAAHSTGRIQLEKSHIYNKDEGYDDNRDDNDDLVDTDDCSGEKNYKYEQSNQQMIYISRMAVLGDSFLSLLLSFTILLVSIIVYHQYISLDQPSHHNNIAPIDPTTTKQKTGVMKKKKIVTVDPYKSLGPIPKIDPPHIYNVNHNHNEKNHSKLIPTVSMIQAFYKDGAVAVRGLISEELLQLLDTESMIYINQQRTKNQAHTGSTSTPMMNRRRKGTQFFTVRHNVLFHQYNSNITTTPMNLSAFAQVALQTAIPAFAATFLNLTTSFESLCQFDDTHHNNNNNDDECIPKVETQTLRVIRDIFLAKDDDEYVCGWHVDDMGFWPATPKSNGINAWIALDSMPLHTGGGFALAIQSHTAPWRMDAHTATGSSYVCFPNNETEGGGYTNASHMFHSRTGSGTCNLQKVAPHLHQRMEDTKRIYDIQRGDVIFHTRWLFHRTIPMTTTTTATQEDPDSERIYRRYSVRYGPGSSSIVPPGYGTELSVLWNSSNGGKSVDDVYKYDGPWYPLAWSSNEDIYWNEINTYPIEFQNLIKSKIPFAEKIAEQRRKEMKPYLKTIAKEQNRFSTHGQ